MGRNLAIVCTVSLASALWSADTQAGTPVNYRVLHTFCATTDCADGALPAGTFLLRDTGGDLFGAAETKGRFNAGTLYELFPKHGGARYFKHVLKAFCESDFCSGGS